MTEADLRAALIKAQSELARLTNYAEALTHEIERVAAGLLADLKQHDVGSRRLPEQDDGRDFGVHDDPEHN